MRSIKTLIAGLAVALLLSTGAFAGSDLNEVGAMLVFPTIVADDDLFVMGDNEGNYGNKIETFVTITNAGSDEVFAHISYINGADPWDDYESCYECDFSIYLSGNDTETLVITSIGGGTRIESEDSDLEMSCPWDFGMLVVTLEDEDGATLTDNVLLGEEVIIDYDNGTAVSIPAVSFQGKDGGDGDRSYAMDDNEFGKMPRIVAADFLAPVAYGHDESSWGRGYANLSLFTLGFERQFPPLTDCSVIGFDAEENPFSASFQFGCWTFVSLCEISPEFCYPNLGLYSNGYGSNDTHGWLQLNCRVDSDDDGDFDANGGVHGAIVQYQADDSKLAASTASGYHSTRFDGAAAWGRLLYQSVTTGDAVTLVLEAPHPDGLF
jgi:hypothetical protein